MVLRVDIPIKDIFPQVMNYPNVWANDLDSRELTGNGSPSGDRRIMFELSI